MLSKKVYQNDRGRGGVKKLLKTTDSRIRVGREPFVKKSVGLSVRLGDQKIKKFIYTTDSIKISHTVDTKLAEVETCFNKMSANLAKFVKIRTIRGVKFLAGLPIRGQRTRKNAKTCKRSVKIRRQFIQEAKHDYY